MKKWYSRAGKIIIGACVMTSANAQTHYGNGAGTQGIGHAFFGSGSGNVNLGDYNTFLGHYSGGNNTTGYGNSFVGYHSGEANTTGSSNTFFGKDAGLKNSVGSQNTFIGRNAGSLSNGNTNTFIGHAAGQANKTGSQNVVIGKAASLLSQGDGNVIIGHESGHWGGGNNSENAIIGYKSGYYNTGNYNVFLGSESGFSNSVGQGNSFLGQRAGRNNTVGPYNTFVGSEAGYENTIGSDNAFLGNKAGYHNKTGYNNIYVGKESGYSSTFGSANAFLGFQSGYLNTEGNKNVFFGNGAGYTNTIGQKNTYLGYGVIGSSSLINATAIGAEAFVDADSSLVLGNKANVGIGVSAPAFQLHLSTDAAAKAGSPDWTVASDSRLKKNVSDFTDGLDLLKQIKPVWFQYNGKAGIETGDKKFVGVIAQEMQKIAPYTIGTFAHQDSLGNKTEYLDYDANAVTYILINSVKEQQKVIEGKEAKIQELENRVEKLEKLMSSLPGASNSIEKEAESGVLEQNVPNGFSNKTSIKYFIPQSVKTAVVDIYTVAGVKVSSHPISERGAGELVISADKYKSGVHVYELVTDGKSMGAKKMLVE
jgi:hypothetical protein